MSPIFLLKTVRHSDDEGFTLIETLVAIIIVGVLAAIAIPGFLGWLNSKRIEDVTTQIFGSLEIARSSAIRLNTPCTVNLNSQRISASPEPCLQAASLVRNVDITNIVTEGVGGTDITFSPRGSTTIVENKSVIVIFDDNSIVDRNMQCIVVSNGIGLMRQGVYTELAPPSSDDDIDDVEAACVTPS